MVKDEKLPSKKESDIKKQPEYPCLVKNCGAVYGNKVSLNNHMEIVHGDNLKKRKICEFIKENGYPCGDTLASTGSLTRHMENVHGVENNKTNKTKKNTKKSEKKKTQKKSEKKKPKNIIFEVIPAEDHNADEFSEEIEIINKVTGGTGEKKCPYKGCKTKHENPSACWRHISSEHFPGNFNYKCKIDDCSAIFQFPIDLINHHKEVHKTKYEPNFNNGKKKSSNIKINFLPENTPELYYFERIEEIESKRKDEKYYRFKCLICGFDSIEGTNRECKTHMKQHILSEKDVDSIVKTEIIDDDPNTIQCSSKDHIKRDKKIKTEKLPTKKIIKEETFIKRIYKMIKKTNAEYKCLVENCEFGDTFKYKEDCARHVISHFPETFEYSCDVGKCCEVFQFPYELLKHKKLIHCKTSEKQFIDNLDNLTADEKRLYFKSLNDNLVRDVNGKIIKKYQCLICGEELSGDYSNFSKHLKTHIDKDATKNLDEREKEITVREALKEYNVNGDMTKFSCNMYSCRNRPFSKRETAEFATLERFRDHIYRVHFPDSPREVEIDEVEGEDEDSNQIVVNGTVYQKCNIENLNETNILDFTWMLDDKTIDGSFQCLCLVCGKIRKGKKTQIARDSAKNALDLII